MTIFLSNQEYADMKGANDRLREEVRLLEIARTASLINSKQDAERIQSLRAEVTRRTDETKRQTELYKSALAISEQRRRLVEELTAGRDHYAFLSGKLRHEVTVLREELEEAKSKREALLDLLRLYRDAGISLSREVIEKTKLGDTVRTFDAGKLRIEIDPKKLFSETEVHFKIRAGYDESDCV